MDIVTANPMFVEIPVTVVKLVIMLLKTRIILAAKVKNISSSIFALNAKVFRIPQVIF